MHAINTVGGIAEWAGGPSRTITSLCSTMASLGCKVDLVAGHDVGRDGKLVAPSSPLVQLHLVKARRIGLLNCYPSYGQQVEYLAVKSMRLGAPVLVHDHGIWGWTNVASAIAAKRAAVPYLLHTRGMLEPWAFEYRGYKKNLAWALYQKHIVASSAALIATSEQECGNLKRRFPKLPVALIPNGVAWPALIPNRAARDDHGRANLLFLSRVHPVKNLQALVKAWGLVCRQPSRANWVLQIAGPNEEDHARDVKAIVTSLGLDSRVEFLGPIGEDEKSAILAAADLFVLPSYTENFGLVVAEALSYGLPVIATRGTPWCLLRDQKCGWWVDPTPTALAQALAEGVDLSVSERHTMGLRGRAFAQKAFSWDGIGLSTIQLYEWVLKRSTSAPPFIYV